jgi:protein-S-isoprenylcysteine O-methyltransferase Ste14
VEKLLYYSPGKTKYERRDSRRPDALLPRESMSSRPTVPAVALILRDAAAYLHTIDPIGGPHIFTARQPINLHKGFIVVAYMAMLYRVGGEAPFEFKQSYGPAAMILLVAHSVYGFAWITKDIFFPDTSWFRPCSLLGAALIFVYPLGVYYLPMWCLVTSNLEASDPSILCPKAFARGDEPWVLISGLCCFLIGFFYHFVGDAQKYFMLKHQKPRSLITDGMFAYVRNPNYFGEILIYTGFAIWSCNYGVFPQFLFVWLWLFWPNMLAKDASMSRYPEWRAWADRSWMVVPNLFAMVADYCRFCLSTLPIGYDENPWTKGSAKAMS